MQRNNVSYFICITATAFIVACSFASCAGFDFALIEKNGFREAKLGSDISTYHDTVFITDGDNGEKYYTRSSDTLTLGDYSLSSIIYGFYKDKLLSISLSTKGYENSRGVLNIMIQEYGNPDLTKHDGREVGWASGFVALLYREDARTHDATTTFLSISLQNQMKNDKNERDKKAGSGL